MLHKNRGLAYSFDKDLPSALSDFIQALKINAHDSKTNYWLGKIKLEKKKYTEAIFYAENARAVNRADKNIKILLKKAHEGFQNLLTEFEKAEKGSNLLGLQADNLLFLGKKLALSCPIVLIIILSDIYSVQCALLASSFGFAILRSLNP